MKHHLLCAFALMAFGSGYSHAEILDWDKIEFWTGEGECKAALVLQFDSPGQQNPGTIVWGYRWEKGSVVTGEDMIRAIARANSDLLLFTQYTGWLGNTVCGLGYAPDAADLSKNMDFDAFSASEDSSISFGFIEPNTSMNQTSAPGIDNAITLTITAIGESEQTHIIEHPLNARDFGYASYDYDWWILQRNNCANPEDSYWNAGWYKGYWSFWLGGINLEDLAYSGLGMSSVELENGDVHGWKYNSFADSSMDGVDGISGASTSWQPINYSHFKTQSGISVPDIESGDPHPQFYRLDGTRVSSNTAPGIYIVRDGKTSRKIYIKNKH